MLDPQSAGLTEDHLEGVRKASSTVTNYAQAVLTAVPKIDNPASWYQPIQADIDTAQGHAREWIESLCSTLNQGIPQAIVDFDHTFQQASSQILDVLREIGTDAPTAKQKSTVSAQLGSLRSAVGSQEDAIRKLRSQVATYADEATADQGRLAADAVKVEERFADGKKWIQEIHTAMGESFLDIESELGPCHSIVTVKIDITLKIRETQADPAAITLVMTRVVLDNLVEGFGDQRSAIQTTLDAWGTLDAKIQAVISDLDDASPAKYPNILRQVDLHTAQSQWSQLSAFASGLLG